MAFCSRVPAAELTACSTGDWVTTGKTSRNCVTTASSYEYIRLTTGAPVDLKWPKTQKANSNSIHKKVKKVKLSRNRPWRPIGLWDVEAPTFSRQSAHRWRWGCQPHAPAALYPQEDSWYSFLLEAESTPEAIVRLEGLGQLKNPMTSSEIEPATFHGAPIFSAQISRHTCSLAHPDTRTSLGQFSYGICESHARRTLSRESALKRRPSHVTPIQKNHITEYLYANARKRYHK
jgi:hypothetical protein